jgi:hypothetical protein
MSYLCAGLEPQTDIHEIVDCCILFPCIPTGQQYIQSSDDPSCSNNLVCLFLLVASLMLILHIEYSHAKAHCMSIHGFTSINICYHLEVCLLMLVSFCDLLKVSYMILARVSPVTHSVGNCVKRVVVIVTSVLFFKTPVSPINSLGGCLLFFVHHSSNNLNHVMLSHLLKLETLPFVLGTGIALAGVFLYSQLKRLKPKPKAA